MKDCKLFTNITTACKGKKGKIVLKKERRKKKLRSQDKPYFVRKSAWVSLTGIHTLMFIILFIYGTIILKSVYMS